MMWENHEVLAVKMVLEECQQVPEREEQPFILLTDHKKPHRHTVGQGVEFMRGQVGLVP